MGDNGGQIYPGSQPREQVDEVLQYRLRESLESRRILDMIEEDHEMVMVKVNDLVWVNGRRGRVTVGPYIGPDPHSDQPTHYVQVELEGLDSHPHEYLESEVFRDSTLYDGLK